MKVENLIDKHLGTSTLEESYINEAKINVPDKIFVELQKRFAEFMKRFDGRAKYLLDDITKITDKASISLKECEMSLNGSELLLFIFFKEDIFEDKEVMNRLEYLLDKAGHRYLFTKRGGNGIIIYLCENFLVDSELPRYVFSKKASVKWS